MSRSVERWVYTKHFMKIHCFRTFYNRSKTRVQCSPFMLWMLFFLLLFSMCVMSNKKLSCPDDWQWNKDKQMKTRSTNHTLWNSISTLNRLALHYIHSQHIRSVCFICIGLMWCALSLLCVEVPAQYITTWFRIDFQHQNVSLCPSHLYLFSFTTHTLTCATRSHIPGKYIVKIHCFQSIKTHFNHNLILIYLHLLKW